MKLTAAQSATVVTTTRSAYPKDAYAQVIDRVLAGEGKADEGKLEETFPNVKPLHVAWKLRQIIKERELESQLNVGKHEEFGICLVYSGNGSKDES